MERPDWPPLTLQEVDALLRKYRQAGGATEILSVSPRPFSAASVVATPRGKVFVKRHAQAVRDREGLLEEHRLIAHLSASMEAHSDGETLVRPVLANGDGETAVTAGEWTYEAHPLADGIDVYERAVSWTPFLCAGHARAAGQAMARLHRAARKYQAPARLSRQLVSSFTLFSGSDSDNDAYSRMESYLDTRPRLREYAEERNWRGSFDELLMPLYRNLEPWLPHLTPLWTHNDFHASNLMWSCDNEGAQVRGIIDFGLADRTNAVHDLATAIERNIVEWLRMAEPDQSIVHLDHLDALLAGYEEISPLSDQEARALVAMLPLVHCEFALSETDYFLSVLHSPDKAYLAYEGYFLAHSQWFQSDEGQTLLTHLEQWAEGRPRAGEGRRW